MMNLFHCSFVFFVFQLFVLVERMERSGGRDSAMIFFSI